MSILVYVATRHPDLTKDLVSRMGTLPQRVLPDNLTPQPMKVIESDGIAIGVVNPTAAVTVQGTSVCIGSAPDTCDWHVPGASHPAGTFALFRSDAAHIELVSDVVASRTIWYFIDDARFVASTSQQAILGLIGGFQFDQRVIPWMLATGALGPGSGWDRRVQRLPGDGSVMLARSSWTLTARSTGVSFSEAPGTDEDHERGLRETIERAVSPLRFDGAEWALPLSGGYDSRGILCLLGPSNHLRTVTWGLRASVDDAGSDASIAPKLAAHYHLRHDFYETDLSTGESVEKVFDRYLVCGEGRLDHVGGYADGLRLWAAMYEDGVRGIIRGDEGFGWIPVTDPADVRLAVGIPLWSDYADLEALQAFGLPGHELPDELLQRPAESLESWRDRLYHQYRIPVVLAALSAVKTPYVEIVSPFLHRQIVYCVRRLPDHLRTDKKAFRSIVRSLTPPIGFARKAAIGSTRDLLKAAVVVECIRQELGSKHATAVLPASFVKYVVSRMVATDDRQRPRKAYRLRRFVKRHTPAALMRLKRQTARPRMDFNVLAFRLYVICRMNRILSGVR
jgi:hypothetical protein